jgi:hypothetical protein
MYALHADVRKWAALEGTLFVQSELELVASSLAMGIDAAQRLHSAAFAALQQLHAQKVVSETTVQRYWPTVYTRFAGGLYRGVIDGNKMLESRRVLTTAQAHAHP